MAKSSDELNKYLSNPERSHLRESILKHEFLYEILMAASLSLYDIKIYENDVDHDGFDVVLDDNQIIKKLQLKSVINGSKTNSWEIHKKLIRLNSKNRKIFDLSDSNKEGFEGGVVLQYFDLSQKTVTVSYAYTDYYVIWLFKEGIISIKGKPKNVFETLMTELQDNKSDKIYLPLSAFIDVKGASELLAISELKSIINESIQNLTRRYSETADLKEKIPIQHRIADFIKKVATKDALKQLSFGIQEKFKDI